MTDPIEQIFRDFYDDLMQPNDDGETRMINYQEWADKARAAMSEEIKAPKKNTLINLIPDTHPSDFEIEKYYCGGLAPSCEEECKGHKIVRDVYETPKKNNDELKDLGHVKEDFLK